MNMMRLKLLAVAFAVTIESAFGAAETVLAERGSTDYAVVCAADAPNGVRFAAWDLSRLLKRVTKAEFPLMSPDSPLLANRKTIEVGTACADALAGSKRLARLGPEGSCSLLVDGTVVLTGKDADGVVGAVYDFLQNQVGCRWYTAWGDERIPSVDRLAIPPFEKLVTPAFEARYVVEYAMAAGRCRNGELFSFRNGFNYTETGCGERRPDTGFFANVELPAGVRPLKAKYHASGPYCHSQALFMPAKGKKGQPGYFEKHPEWFSFVSDGAGGGKRVPDRLLCFSNPEMCAEFRRNLYALVDAKGGEGVYNVGVNDLPGLICECDRCRALVERYGTVGAPVFVFTKELAADMLKRYPKALLITSAYRRAQTQEPPNDAFGRFPDNVVINWSPIDDDLSKDAGHANNFESLRQLAGWRARARHLWSWYFPVPYFPSPYPYSGIRRSAADTRIMLAAGLNGAGYEHDVARDMGANFFDMQNWIFAKLFREPGLDEDALAKEFCRDYYGAAGEEMYRHYDELERLREESDVFLEWCKYLRTALTPENVVRWNVRFDRMEELVKDDPAVLQHVREARLGLDYVTIARYAGIRRIVPSFAATPESIRDRGTNTLMNAFRRRCNFAQAKASQNDVMRFVSLCELADVKDFKPAEFKDVPDADICQSLTIRATSGCRRQKTADSPSGTSAWDPCEAKSGRKDLPFELVGTGKALLSGKILNRDMVEGKFHYYRLGRVRLTPECRLVPTPSWYVVFQLDDLYVPGVDEEWDVYLSAKFEGPQYFPDSKAESRASFDRVVLIRAKKREGV